MNSRSIGELAGVVGRAKLAIAGIDLSIRMERVPGRVWQVCAAGLQNPIRSIADLEVGTVGILLVRIAVARENRRLNVKRAPRDGANFGGRRSGSVRPGTT